MIWIQGCILWDSRSKNTQGRCGKGSREMNMSFASLCNTISTLSKNTQHLPPVAAFWNGLYTVLVVSHQRTVTMCLWCSALWVWGLKLKCTLSPICGKSLKNIRLLGAMCQESQVSCQRVSEQPSSLPLPLQLIWQEIHGETAIARHLWRLPCSETHDILILVSIHRCSLDLELFKSCILWRNFEMQLQLLLFPCGTHPFSALSDSYKSFSVKVVWQNSATRELYLLKENKHRSALRMLEIPT